MKHSVAIVACCALMAMPVLRALAGEEKPCSACPSSPAAVMASMKPTTQPTSYKNYGEPPRMTDADNRSAADVLKDIPAFEGKSVRLTGVVTGVCKKKGCWIKMSSEGSPLNVFVHFTCPVEGRLIPMEARGKPVIVEGKIKVKEISEADARHIAEEEGLSAEQVQAIAGPQKQIELEGPTALIAD
jgi:hypothetical protein